MFSHDRAPLVVAFARYPQGIDGQRTNGQVSATYPMSFSNHCLSAMIVCWSPAQDNKKKGEQKPALSASPIVVMEALVIAEATTARSCWIVWSGGVWRGDHIVNSSTAPASNYQLISTPIIIGSWIDIDWLNNRRCRNPIAFGSHALRINGVISRLQGATSGASIPCSYSTARD
jgi:hypothetical protein